MSYILEALKRSQLERPNGEVPTLDSVAWAPETRRWPLAPMAAALLTGVVLASLLAYWWAAARDPVPPVVTAPLPPPAPVRPVAASLPPKAPESAPLPAERAPAPPAAAPRPGKPVTVASVPRPPVKVVATPTPVSWSDVDPKLRSQIGSLEVSIHLYSDQPTERLVFINGRQYQEGATLKEGPQLERIEPAGIVLSYDGTRFRLPL